MQTISDSDKISHLSDYNKQYKNLSLGMFYIRVYQFDVNKSWYQCYQNVRLNYVWSSFGCYNLQSKKLDFTTTTSGVPTRTRVFRSKICGSLPVCSDIAKARKIKISFHG